MWASQKTAKGEHHMFVSHKIAKVEVSLVSQPVTTGAADATRKVETIGFLIVKLTTDQGLEGFGVTYHEVGGEATQVLIEENIKDKLIGRDPFETDAFLNEMSAYLRGVGRKGLMWCALSAVDIAMWDLKGKITGLPVCKLIGGNRNKVEVYASGGWTSYDDDRLVDEITGMVKDGYKKVKFKVGVEGGQNLKRDVRRVEKVRLAVGPDIGIMLDANNCWDAATGARFANMVKELDIMFLEEPVMADDLTGLAKYKRSTDLPLATGEHEYTKYGVRDLLINNAADIIQTDGARTGGFTELLKIAALTQAWNVKLAPHAMELIHMQIAAGVSNCPFLEKLILFDEITYNTFKDAPRPVNGILDIPDKPGLGLELNEDFIKENSRHS